MAPAPEPTPLAPPEEIELGSLGDALDAAFSEGKAVFVCDPSGNASTFLGYKSHVMDVKGLFVLDKMNGKPHEEISEDARKQLV